MDLYPTATKYDGIAFYFKYANNKKIEDISHFVSSLGVSHMKKINKSPVDLPPTTINTVY